jgi:hypothetical protein
MHILLEIIKIQLSCTSPPIPQVCIAYLLTRCTKVQHSQRPGVHEVRVSISLKKSARFYLTSTYLTYILCVYMYGVHTCVVTQTHIHTPTHFLFSDISACLVGPLVGLWYSWCHPKVHPVWRHNRCQAKQRLLEGSLRFSENVKCKGEDNVNGVNCDISVHVVLVLNLTEHIIVKSVNLTVWLDSVWLIKIWFLICGTYLTILYVVHLNGNILSRL